MSIDDSKQYIATIYTAKGEIVMELDALYAPQHVNNFVFLAKEGFFDGLTFHRYDPGFVIQGGDPLGVGTGGPGYRIPAEIGLLHEKGAVAMARQGAMNPQKKSSGSQFYITLKATPFLDGDYSVFGKVVAGMDVVQQIRRGDVMTKVVVEEK
ncbi:MAG: peptidylprolyl isomerase [Caldithrix sp.]|nr:MAG: peptidylprolyl isomerase [Caldithrix sp.]